VKHHRFWQNEQGFTLPEVVMVIALMGIVFAIASSSWFGMVESRRVDSATNQVVSDLRLAHTSATNRLTEWRVELDPNSGNYRIGSGSSSGFVGTPSSRSLEEGTEFPPTLQVVAVVFRPNGEAQVTGTGNIKVAADDGAPIHEIEVNTVTSRIKVVS
jgi:prepilin-type N-terminal cleavage/methylation domain-containing protein